MRVLHITSEAVPFAKTGGLGDVGGALPTALAELGLKVAVVMPYYKKVAKHAASLTRILSKVDCPFAGAARPFSLWQGYLPGAIRVPVWFVRNEGIFEVGDDLYGTEPGSYGDGHVRFIYFAEAAIRVAKAVGFRADIVHLHDWQAALVAPLLRTRWRNDPDLSSAATVITIHNLAYQGVFPLADLEAASLPSELLEEGRLLKDGTGNLLAGGLRFVDGISTVSRTYAQEILTPEFGNGLDGLLRWREPLLDGIVNGLDTTAWDPENDTAIAASYSSSDLSGKSTCKSALLKAAGLSDQGGPVFGAVARLVSQKGLDLLATALPPILRARPDARVVILGTGEPGVENALNEVQAEFQNQVCVWLKFDDPLAHRVEAGSDFFLMPSRFEPCGLNQLISMRYGTPPIVRRTGGLADTVTDASHENLLANTATGVVFDESTPAALQSAIERALILFDNGNHVAMAKAGMSTDWSWARSAREHILSYARATERRTGGSQHLHEVLPSAAPEPAEPWLPPLPEIPDSHQRDTLYATARDPWTVFALWEIGGEESTQRWLSLSANERANVTYTLRLINAHTRVFHDIDAGGLAKEWMATVAPDTTFEVELLVAVPGRPLERIMTSAPVTTPPTPPVEAAIS